MDRIESISKENNEIVTAGIFISCDKAVIDAEKIITEQLDLIHKFVQVHDIIIVDSYIDRLGNKNYERMLADAQGQYFDIILVCGSPAAVAVPGTVVIDVLKDN